ncbi:hypothetical protein TNCV_3374741 [Trichonephila clavipes]|nr:hypothetical protein TNCV_3374741 [Trichonephila clavipes]
MIEIKRVCERLRDTASCRNGTDKAWLYYYDPTIKQQISEWKHPSSPTPKKAKTVKSAGQGRPADPPPVEPNSYDGLQI